MKNLVIMLAMVGATSTAFAQVTAIGPFTGNNQEGFETQTSGMFTPCLPTTMFGNQADICTPNASGIHITGGWGFQCSLGTHGGSRLMGSTGSAGGTDITFTVPPSRFGGYFAMNHPHGPDITVSFFAGPNLVSGPTVVQIANDCNWNWLGWSFGSTGVDRINIVTSHSSGGYIQMDDLEADINACSTPYGQGCAGTGGFVPKLSTTGCPTAGANVSINIDEGLGGATALLLLGANQAQIPVGGGCFLNISPIFPAVTPIPLGGSGPGQGSISLFGPIPSGVSGVVIRSQVFVIDPGVIVGFSSTAGLELTIQ